MQELALGGGILGGFTMEVRSIDSEVGLTELTSHLPNLLALLLLTRSLTSLSFV